MDTCIHMGGIEMKHGKIFLLALLILALAISAAQASAPVLTLRSYHPDLNRYIGLDMDDFDGAWTWNLINDVEVENWEEMRNFYGGSPTWRVERVSGVDFPFTYNAEDFGTWGRVDVRCEDIGQVAGDTVLKYTCEWGGQTAAVTSTIHIRNMDNGVPQDLNYPRVIDTLVGQTVTIAPTILPAGWSLYNYTPALTFNSGEMEEFSDLISQTDTQAQFKMTKAGIYKALVMMGADTVTIGHEVTFRVKDANGDLPQPDIKIRPRNLNFYIGIDNRDNSDVNYYNQTTLAWMDNYWDLQNTLNGDPQWSARQVSGDPLGASFESYSDDSINIELNQIPDHPIEAGIEITVDWDGVTVTVPMTVHIKYADNGLPTGFDPATLPDVIETQVGQQLTIAPQVLPAGWSLPGYKTDLWFNPGDIDPFGTYTNPTRDTAVIDVTKAGLYHITVSLSTDTISVFKQVTVKVKDANGNMPKPTLQLGGNYADSHAYIGMPAYASALGSDNESPAYGMMPWFQYDIDNFDELENYYGGEPQWTVTQTAGTPIRIDHWPDLWYMDGRQMYYYSMEIQEAPSTPTVAEWDVTCTWGDQTDTKHIKVEFLESPNGAPKDTDYPKVVELQVGDTLVIEPHYVPATWTLPGQPSTVYVFDEQMEPFATLDQQASTDTRKVYTVDNPGYYNATILLVANGIHAGHETLFKVKDANGTLPPMELDITCNQGTSFERDFYIGMDFEAHTFYTGKVQTDPQITYFYLDNAYLYSRMLQGDPVWKATRKQGTANVSIEDNGVDGMNLDIISLPASPEDAVYLIECDWDGVHWEEEYTVHFKNSPVGLPTGLEVDFGDHLIVRTGEEIKLRDNVRFKNGWRIYGEDYSVPLGGDGNIWDGVNDWGNYFGNEPGIYQANVSAMSANVRWIEDFTLIVTRADGTLPVSARPAPATLIRLPANTQRIETQAFAGSPIGSIDIPADVTFIADDAFDGCGLVYAYCHSQYAIDYAVSHGLVAMVD